MTGKFYTLCGLAVLAMVLAVPADAGPSRGGRGAHAHSGHHGARHAVGAHPRAYSAPRHYAPRVGVYFGAPVLASAYFAPRYYYPPAYVPHDPMVQYYCPAYGDYYPRVQVCPGGWQQVVQPPLVPGYPPYY